MQNTVFEQKGLRRFLWLQRMFPPRLSQPKQSKPCTEKRGTQDHDDIDEGHLSSNRNKNVFSPRNG